MAYIGSTPTSQNFIAGTDYFNGTGSQTAFTLTRSVNSVNDIEVTINNVVQQPNSYTVSGTTLTISAAPSSGTSNVYVRYLSTTLQSITVPSNSIDSSKLASLSSIPVTGGYTATFPAATGTIMVSGNMPAFGAYQNNNTTSIASGTWTLCPNNTEYFDTNGCYNNTGSTVTLNGLSVPAYAFMPNVAGYYQVNACTSIYSGMTGKMFIAIYKTGSSYCTGNEIGFTASVTQAVGTVQSVVYLNGTTDYVQIYAWHNIGTTQSIDYGTSGNWFNCAMVRAA